MAHIEMLEAENVRLIENSTDDCQSYLCIENIHDDKLI